MTILSDLFNSFSQGKRGRSADQARDLAVRARGLKGVPASTFASEAARGNPSAQQNVNAKLFEQHMTRAKKQGSKDLSRDAMKFTRGLY